MNNLQKYIREVFDFENNQDPASFEERVGEPEELDAVIGKICLGFQFLEDEITKRIIQMIQTDVELGTIITAELSFKNKVNLFASLYHRLKATYKFNSIKNFEEEYFKELIKAITKCEELRNQILHSNIDKSWITEFRIIRKKNTAKAKQGLRIISEEINIPYLFNIADYIVSMAMEVEQFFLVFEKKQMDVK